MIYEFNKFLFNESSIYDLKYKDIEKQAINDWDTSDFTNLVDEFKYDYVYTDIDFDELDNEEIEELPQYKEWFKFEVENRYENAMWVIKDKITDGQLTIWRVITVNSEWLEHFLKKGKHLGIFWSWDESSAEAHGGYNQGKNIEVRFQCTIDERQVKWKETIIKNMHPSLGDEDEIELVKNSRLKLDRMEINNKEYDLSNLKNRTFLS